MKLYGNNFTYNSNKVRFAANAMGVAYEFQSIDLGSGEQRKPEFLKVNALGRIPVLSDGTFTIAESNTIMRYLAGKTNSKLYPQELQKRVIVDQWLDFGSIHLGAAMGKMLFNTFIYKMVGAEKDIKSLEEGRGFLNTNLGAVESQLRSTPYITGQELSLADFNILAIIDPAESVGFDLSVFPKVVAWRKNLQAQDFYKKVFSSYTDYLNGLFAAKA